MGEYNDIAADYDVLNALPYREIEKQNVFAAIHYFLTPGVKVLDLACGTGYYTANLMSWGASFVVGVDMSPAMLSVAASGLASFVSSGAVEFVAKDGRDQQSFAPDGKDGYFDLVFGGWFLNYAKDAKELTAMFSTIQENLRPGGTFIGIVPHPCNDLAQRAAKFTKSPLTAMRPRNKYVKELENGEGWELHVYINDEGVDFRTWHLKRDVYERCAREAGLGGKLEWRPESLVGDDWKDALGLKGEDDYLMRKMTPHFGILVVQKDVQTPTS